ncbi:MAG: NADH:ubiquinone reductase (Na(+)-transporting) subunit B [Bacteroidetes bacterium MED-G17]|nr:MAG: NADH:ubiquinone reductase (Na(+)-transporting) subunit B [Bacteroidetes bacterium TMED39]PDH53610.1 MAG: NADH:ubiquinone reductase (Na(+)-transporting) subunit B [Bacteroidetes bacterium MED-G17]CAI8334012.1 MAG: Na(+)-translocating NADH-quinone reductase subunit B [Bacteroidetes bacterium MED-G17]|tara:strand:+ start:6698 stop:7861 length:1164 start_codon:yes stop_codon:yes gene_type:complete
MKFLRNYVEKIKPNFEEGGKLHFLHSTFDAFETFLFVPNHVTKNGVHIRDGIDIKRTMFMVIVALIPATLFGMWNVGYQHFLSMGQSASFFDAMWYGTLQTLPIIVVSYAAGLGVEFAFAQVKKHPVSEGFLVSALLIPLCLPPDIPLWMVAIATIFSVVVGKEVFGGTGMNILNPALTARVFLYFAYPGAMSGGYDVWVANASDGYTGATNLAEVYNASNAGEHFHSNTLQASAWDSFMGWIPGSIGETSTLMCLLGAAFLIFIGIGSWRIILSTFIGGAVMGLILNLVGGNAYYEMPFYYHLIIGGFAFGAIFMATDPVSAAQTNRGKILYGFLIGVLTVLIRVFNPAYPEGIMMAILLMNVFAPLFDYYVVKSNIKKRLSRVKA